MKALLACIAAAFCTSLGAAEVDEATLKVALIYNFIQMSEWPTPIEGRFELCVAGLSSIDSQLAGLNGQRVHRGANIFVRRLDDDDPLTRCHALFLDERNHKVAERLLRRIGRNAILTITDAAGLVDRGWMIEVFRQQRRLAFDVNLLAAKASGISLSSRILQRANFVLRTEASAVQ